MLFKPYYGDFRRVRRKRTDPQGAGPPFLLRLGARLQVVESCSSAGFAAREPGQSDAAETRDVSHGQVVLTVGAAAPAQVKTSKSLEFSFRRAALGPGALLSDTWDLLSQQTPSLLLRSLPLKVYG